MRRPMDVTFDGPRGDVIRGVLTRPDGEVRARALFAHCFTCNKDYKAPVHVSRALAAHGIATLRFDFPGLGESGGDVADTTLTGNAGDVVAAAEFLERRGGPPEILIGHSLGGTACLRAAPRIDAARLVATIAAPADAAHLPPALEAARDEARHRGVGRLVTGGGSYPLKRAFFEDLARSGGADAVRALDRALLVFHSPTDLTVPFAAAEALVSAAPHPRSLITLPGAGHLLADRADCAYVAAVIAAWVTRYLA